MRRLFYIILAFAIFTVACKDETVELEPKTVCSEHFETYVYKGVYIDLDYVIFSDESVEFRNDTTSSLFESLLKTMESENLSILTFSDEENVVYIFDSSDEKEEYLKTIRRDLSNDLKSALWHPLYINCYQNSGFNYMLFDASDPDDGITPTHYNSGNWDGFPNLSYVNGSNYDNKLSSIQVLNYTGMEAEIALFSDAAYKGYNWTIYVRPSSVNNHGDSNQDDGYRGSDITELVDFSERYMSGWGFWKKDWDDRVSSIKWRQIDCVGECLNY